MKSLLICGLAGFALIAGTCAANAEVIKPLIGEDSQPKGDRAEMYFDSTNRMNLKLLTQFVDVCAIHPDVECVYAESSNETDQNITSEFAKISGVRPLYKGKTDKPMPHFEFYKGGKLVGTLEQEDNLVEKPNIYLDYISGSIDSQTLVARLKATDSADLYKKIVPKMNFVLMLAKKGETDAALKELESVDISKLDDKGKLIFAQTYLRLKAPKKAMEVLKGCESSECMFYTGVAQYVDGDIKGAIGTLNGLKGKYKDINKLNYYLKEMYKADGDKKHADEIKLPNNYNPNAD